MLGAGEVLDAQMRIVELGLRHGRMLGEPRRIGGPFSWLPDGDGLILKRFERTDDPKAIEPRVICRLGLDGKLTDLRSGDWPLVLRKSRRILYTAGATRLWYTCALDGTASELFADGLAKHGMPAISSDETKVIFTRYDQGKMPQLRLFEFGKSTGTSVTKAAGFTGVAVWR